MLPAYILRSCNFIFYNNIDLSFAIQQLSALVFVSAGISISDVLLGFLL